MDNICHTLVGAALGEAGLKHRTRFGNVTLMIASNLPDIDVLVFASGSSPVAFRRGWTHGVIAQLLLPVALTGVMMLVARVKKRQSPAALRNDQTRAALRDDQSRSESRGSSPCHSLASTCTSFSTT